jgi:hypothetical protein
MMMHRRPSFRSIIVEIFLGWFSLLVKEFKIYGKAGEQNGAAGEQNGAAGEQDGSPARLLPLKSLSGSIVTVKKLVWL